MAYPFQHCSTEQLNTTPGQFKWYHFWYAQLQSKDAKHINQLQTEVCIFAQVSLVHSLQC